MSLMSLAAFSDSCPFPNLSSPSVCAGSMWDPGAGWDVVKLEWGSGFEISFPCLFFIPGLIRFHVLSLYWPSDPVYPKPQWILTPSPQQASGYLIYPQKSSGICLEGEGFSTEAAGLSNTSLNVANYFLLPNPLKNQAWSCIYGLCCSAALASLELLDGLSWKGP